ncbi:MAG: acyl-CoA dehydratase activase [Clostridia bacterium]|nr:acyl-CoA dehydratase activase [Clostridia bacterium]
MTYYICKYTPVEILDGFGEKYRLYNPVAQDCARADQLIHRNVCSFSRALIETCVKNNSNPIVLTSCCDSIQRTYDVLQAEGHKVFMLYLPHNSQHCSKLVYKEQILKFIRDYAAYSGKKFSCAKFRAAFKQNSQSVVGGYIGVMGARMGEKMLEFIKNTSPLAIRNNTCTGVRNLGNPPLTDDLEELMDWYTDQLLSQTACMRMTDISSRRALVDDPNLKGIIYNTVSFCDFYGFEYAHIKRSLDVPVLKIETDYTPQVAAQLKTRLEAFFENLKVGKNKRQFRYITPKHFQQIYTAGIDSGSTSTNAVILDSQQRIVSFSVLPTGAHVLQSAEKAFDSALNKAGLSQNQISRIVTTGYGRTNIDFCEKDVTEITCHAIGAHFLNNAVRTVIDIGGQDSKVIHLDEDGKVLSFVMNDKCAAGTGRFLEMMAQSLGLTIQQMSTYGLKWEEQITISSMCSVFAQSEVVSLIAADKKLEDIVHGINQSVASKVMALGGRTGMKPEYMITGGVAKNIGVVRAVEQRLGSKVIVPEQPEICGALGAAIIASKD